MCAHLYCFGVNLVNLAVRLFVQAEPFPGLGFQQEGEEYDGQHDTTHQHAGACGVAVFAVGPPDAESEHKDSDAAGDSARKGDYLKSQQRKSDCQYDDYKCDIHGCDCVNV